MPADPLDQLTFVDDGPRTLVSCGCWWDTTGGVFHFRGHAPDCPVTDYVLQAAAEQGVPMLVVTDD